MEQATCHGMMGRSTRTCAVMSRPRTSLICMTALSLLLAAAAAVAQPRAERGPDPFRPHAVEGAFALVDTGSDKMTVLNRRLAARRFAPFSTFEIPNTGKTGLGWQDGRAIGWLVGSVEHRGRGSGSTRCSCAADRPIA